MASNPLPIYVPCHRVIKSDGTIGNYGGGIERKLKLLGAEGFRADRGNRLPGTAVYGHWASRIFCRPACTSVRRASRKRWLIFGDAAHARGAGMRACKVCHPA
jgi:6-O-methylguanine DNA methyltransferase-like protein/metal binding Ada-like protein